MTTLDAGGPIRIASQRPPLDCVNVLGVPIAAATLESALDLIDAAIASRMPMHIGVVNAAKIVNMRRDEQLRQSVLASDVVFADGMSVVWASRALGRLLPERVAGIDLMTGMLRRGNTRAYRVYCLGATDEVLKAAIARIKADYPGVTMAGSRNGYFTAAQEADVAADIAASRADILFVAITSPKKENFMDHWAAQMNVPVIHGVGGSFDVLAGKVQRAPTLWQKFGLEWLYRVKQEPGRLWKRYLVTNTLFISMVVRELFRSEVSTPGVMHRAGERRR
jgi:N-acetylglucosaminyldiphosphoundecaprenol N-acetyl-beta-D-mannosaminyltransferase